MVNNRLKISYIEYGQFLRGLYRKLIFLKNFPLLLWIWQIFHKICVSMNVGGVRLVNKKSFLTEKHHMTFVQAQIREMLTNQKPGPWCLDQWEARTWPTLRHTECFEGSRPLHGLPGSLQADHNIAAKYAPDCSSQMLHVCSACSVPTNWGTN